jgi:hypothetical protein
MDARPAPEWRIDQRLLETHCACWRRWCRHRRADAARWARQDQLDALTAADRDWLERMGWTGQ